MIRLTVAISLMFFSASAMPETKLLSQACEEALALSALPKRLRDQASVYVLTEDGFQKTITSDGPFTCIVERSHPVSLIPQCPDSAGADTIIPALIHKSTRAVAGVPSAEIKADFEKRTANGEFKPPRRPGISWMLSSYNYTYVPSANKIFHVPAHLMYYAPYLSNDDIGGSQADAVQGNRGVPFILEEGIHGYMISFAESPSDSADVVEACGAQVPDTAPEIL